MKSKNLFSLMVIAGFVVLILASSGYAQIAKFGYVDSDRIFAEFKEWGKAQEEFNIQYKAWDDEAKTMQKELEEIMTEYEKQKLILSAEKKKEREAVIDTKRQALDSFTKDIFGPAGTAERKNNELVKPLLEKINAAIERAATEGNYDFVYNSSGLAYAKKEYEMTDKVLKLLEAE
jgi:outer membrane protein